MPTGEVNTYLTGENLANPNKWQMGTLIAQGEGGTKDTRHEITNYNQAKNIFISGKILDLVKHYFDEFPDGADGGEKIDPVPLYCVRPDNTVAGSIGNVAHTGTGLATTVTTGTPTGTRKVILEILKDGASETATYRKSTDGGETWGSEIITPASETPIALAAGASIAFTDNVGTPADSFKKGDTYTIQINGPKPADADVLAAVESEKRNYNTNFIYVAHAGSSAFWTSLAAIGDEAETEDHNNIFIICEATGYVSGPVADFYQARVDEANVFTHRKISAVSTWGKSSITGNYENYGIAYFAKLCSGPVNENPGWVKRYRVRTFTDIQHWDDGYRDYMNAMYDKGLVAAKEYDDYMGIFIAAGQTMEADSSPYRRVENLRRGNKIRKIVRQECIPFLKSDINPGAGSGGMDYLTMLIDQKITSQMERTGKMEITRHETKLWIETAGQTKTVKGNVKFYEAGSMDAIDVDVEHKADEV